MFKIYNKENGGKKYGKENTKRSKSVALAQAILEKYQPETKEDVQDAMKDIFGPIFEAMLQKGEMNAHLGYESNNHDYKQQRIAEMDTQIKH